MNKKERIIRFYETGDADVLSIDELEPQRPIENEVKIRVDALGLNRAEIMFRTGNYLESPTFPSRLGYEASGTVIEMGSKASSVKIGERVSTIPAFSMGKYGVYGETAIVPESALARFPDNLSAEEGTSIWMPYITAYGALLDIGHLKNGQTVLITAASSSVGLAAIQIAKAVNATVIAATRTSTKIDFLKSQGADFVVALENDNLEEMTKNITSDKGVDLIFDPVAGPMLSRLAEVAARGATIIEYGALSEETTEFPLFNALSKGLKIQGYTLFEITGDPVKLEKAKKYVFNALSSGKLKPVIDKIFHFEDIAEAHRYMESNRQKGKIVVSLK